MPRPMQVKHLIRKLRSLPGYLEVRVATAEGDVFTDMEFLTSVEKDVAGRLVLVGEHEPRPLTQTVHEHLERLQSAPDAGVEG